MLQESVRLRIHPIELNVRKEEQGLGIIPAAASVPDFVAASAFVIIAS